MTTAARLPRQAVDLFIFLFTRLLARTLRKFQRDWSVSCLSMLYEQYLETRRSSNRQRSHSMRSCMDPMSAASPSQCADALLLQLPDGYHEQVRGIAAACQVVTEGILKENDERAIRAGGSLHDPPLPDIKCRLRDLLWRMDRVTPLGHTLCGNMAFKADDCCGTHGTSTRWRSCSLCWDRTKWEPTGSGFVAGDKLVVVERNDFLHTC